jgi:serine/threonine protein kinase
LQIIITMDSFLGRGGFGKVYRGSWTQNGDQVPAAIKSIQHTNSEEEFQREIDLLRQMDHLFVVKFLGSTVVDSVK